MAKVPLAIIQNELGVNMLSNLDRNQVYITYFKYTMEDDEEDKCIIRLQAKSVEAIIRTGIFDYDTALRVLWGFVGQLCSPIIIYIRDVKTHYGEDIIYMELNCTDLSSYLKSTKTQGTGKVTILEYLKLFVEDKYRATIKYNGKIIWRSYSKLLPGQLPGINPNTGYEGNSNTPKNLLSPTPPETVTNTEPPEPNDYFDDTQSAPTIGMFLNTPVDIVSANISPYHVLRNIFRQAPDGPWFISGGGNNLQIHNRNLRNSPNRSYTYRSDKSFLSFVPTSKREVADANILSYTTLDPTTKIMTSRESYIQSLKGLKPLPDIVKDKSISKEEQVKGIKSLLESYMGYLNHGVDKRAIFARDPLALWHNKPDQGYKGRYIPKDASPSDQFHAMMNNLSIAGYIYSAPLDYPGAEIDTMKNVAKNIEMERVEADIKVEGDPGLVPDSILSVKGLLPAHNGNWYVKKSEHEINSSGYITNCEVFIVDDANSQSLYKTDTEVNPEGDDFEKRYLTEEKLFNDINNLKVLVGSTPGGYYLPGVQSSEVSHYKNVEEALQEGGIDINQNIEKIAKLISESKTQINPDAE